MEPDPFSPWHTMVGAAVLSVVGYGVVASLWTSRSVLSELAASFCLWYATELLTVSLCIAQAPAEPFPRDRRASLLVFMTSLLLGVWAGYRDRPLLILTWVIVIATAERLLYLKYSRPAAHAQFISFRVWATSISGGLASGILLQVLLRLGIS